MKEIIFWFSNSRIKNYWFNYTMNFLDKHTLPFKCKKYKNEIEITDVLKISFKTSSDNETADLAGRWNINQYWVEDLFDNNFKVFFTDIMFDNFNWNKMNI